MLMIAAFCPPEDVAAELRAAVEAGDLAWANDARPAPETPARRKWFGRSAAPEVDAGPLRTSVARWAVPIVPVIRFGNLTTADARRVVDALAEVAVDWRPAEVHIEQVVFGTRDAPRSVRAVLGGDVEVLQDIARAVASRAADLNFYLDRRLFDPTLEVAGVTDDITDDDLAALTATLDGFQGRSWLIDHLSVLKQTFGDGTPAFTEEYVIQFGTE